MSNFSYTFRSSLSLVLIIFAASISSCIPRGTDEANLYTDINLAYVDFNTLNQLVLTPYCIQCHASFATSDGLSDYLVAGNAAQSSLYQKVASGQMPKGGSPLSAAKVSLVATYINGLAAANVPLAATWASLKVNLIQKTCISCHHAGGQAITQSGDSTLDFSQYINVKTHAPVDLLADVQTADMPPSDSGVTPPTSEVITVLQQWMDAGYPL